MQSEVIKVSNLDLTFEASDGPVHALKNVNLKVNKGEIVSFIGPSGCGKTTLLRVLADLDEPTNGQVTVNGVSPREARELWGKKLEKGAQAGLIQQYASPHLLEILFEFNRLGFEHTPGINFQVEINRSLHEPNIHLRGVALRLRAMDRALKDEDGRQIELDLTASEEYLVRSGDQIQLAKTRLEMARIKLSQRDQEKARLYAQKAWQGFSGYQDEFYPDDLRTLLVVKKHRAVDKMSHEEFFERFTTMIQDLVPTTDLDELMDRVVVATNRFFGAERGCLFWFSRRETEIRPNLRAAYNLNQNHKTN